MDQSYIGCWIVRLDSYHMIIEHRMQGKYQKTDSLSKKINCKKDWSKNMPIRQKPRKDSRF